MDKKEENIVEEFKKENDLKIVYSDLLKIEIEISSAQPGLKTKITEIVKNYYLGGSIVKNFNETINKKIITFLVIYGQTRVVSECWNDIINFLKSQNIKFEQNEWASIPLNKIEEYPPQFLKLKTEYDIQNKNSEGKSISSGINECIYQSDFNYAFNKVKDESFLVSLKSNLKKIDTKKVATGLINIVSNRFFNKDLSSLTTPQTKSNIFPDIELKVKIPTGLINLIRLPYDYTETDFLKCVKRKFKKELVEKFEDNFSYFKCDNSGTLIQLSEITNLNNDSFVFLYHSRFCEENLLFRLEEIGRCLYAPAIVYSGIYSLNDLLEQIYNRNYWEKLEKIVGENVDGLRSRLKNKIN